MLNSRLARWCRKLGVDEDNFCVSRWRLRHNSDLKTSAHNTEYGEGGTLDSARSTAQPRQIRGQYGTLRSCI